MRCEAWHHGRENSGSNCSRDKTAPRVTPIQRSPPHLAFIPALHRRAAGELPVRHRPVFQAVHREIGAFIRIFGGQRRVEIDAKTGNTSRDAASRTRSCMRAETPRPFAQYGACTPAGRNWGSSCSPTSVHEWGTARVLCSRAKAGIFWLVPSVPPMDRGGPCWTAFRSINSAHS